MSFVRTTSAFSSSCRTAWFALALIAASSGRLACAAQYPRGSSAIGGEVTEEQKASVARALPQATEAATPRKSRRVLIFCRTEDWVHQCIPIANHALTELGRVTGAFSVVVRDDMAVFTSEALREFDAILLNNTTRLAFADPAHRAAFKDFVEGGRGLIGIHGAVDNFPNWPEAAAMIGAQFVAHPFRHSGTWAVKLDEPGHPLTRAFGERGFWIQDEIYELGGPYSRGTHRVLLSLDMSQPENRAVKTVAANSADADFPIAWVKRAGRGRVFYSSLGHHLHMYWDARVLRHYLSGIQYALGDLDVPDEPSGSLRPKSVPALAPSKSR